MLCASGMKHVQHEWDWPAPRRHYRRYRTIDADGMPVAARPDFNFKHPRCYQPGSGWNSPVTKKIIDAYWQVTITIVKVLVAVPLTAMIIGAIWLIWVLVTL
jgi:hypothetical protein